MPNEDVENKGRTAFAIRNDAGGDLAGADGDAGPLQFDSVGRLRVLVSGAGAGGASAIDDSAFAIGVDAGTPAMGLADEVAPDSVDEGDVGVLRMSLNRILYTVLRDSAGNERGANINASNQLSVSADDVTPGTGATNLGKEEDTLHSSGDVGVMSLGVRVDAGGPLAADLDYHPFLFDSVGRLRVLTQGAAGGTSAVDDSAFTVAVDSGTPIMGFADEVAPDSVNEGDVGVVRMSLNRNLYTVLRDAAGNERGADIDATNRLTVSVDNSPTLGANSGVDIGDVDVTSVVPGVAATNLGKAEDAVHGSGDTGVMALAVRSDAGGALSADGDYIPFITDSAGRLRTVNQLTDASIVDDAAFTPAVSAGIPAFGFFDDVAPDSVDEGDAGAIRMSANRNLYVNVRDAAGNERGANVDASNRIEAAIQGAAGDPASVRLSDGAAFYDAPSSSQLPAVLVGGRLDVVIGASLPAGTNNIGDVDVLTIPATAAEAAALPAVFMVMAGDDGTDTHPLQLSVSGDLKITLDGEAVVLGAGAAAIGTVAVTNVIPGVTAADLGKTEDAIHGSGDTGVMSLAVRDDVPVGLAADGDYIPLTTSDLGKLWTGGHVDDTAFAAASDTGFPLMAKFDDAAVDSVDEDDAGIVRMSANRNLYATLRDAAGNERGVNVNASSQLAVSVDNTPQIEGNVANDAVDTGNPVKVGARAINTGTNPAEVANNDRIHFLADRQAMPFYLLGHPAVLTREFDFTGVQTNFALLTVGTAKIVVLMLDATLSNDAAAAGIRIGLATATLPAVTTAGVAQIVLSHAQIAPGSGLVKGMGGARIAIGASGEDLRLTCGTPSPGNWRIIVTYYLLTEA